MIFCSKMPVTVSLLVRPWDRVTKLLRWITYCSDDKSRNVRKTFTENFHFLILYIYDLENNIKLNEIHFFIILTRRQCKTFNKMWSEFLYVKNKKEYLTINFVIWSPENNGKLTHVNNASNPMYEKVISVFFPIEIIYESLSKVSANQYSPDVWIFQNKFAN